MSKQSNPFAVVLAIARFQVRSLIPKNSLRPRRETDLRVSGLAQTRNLNARSSLGKGHNHDDQHGDDGHRNGRVLPHVCKGLLGIGCHQHSEAQGHSHDGGSDTRGACVVDRLEVDVEGELLVRRLQGVSTPLVARR